MQWNKTSEILPKCMTLCLVAYEGYNKNKEVKQALSPFLCMYIGGNFYACLEFLVDSDEHKPETTPDYWMEVSTPDGGDAWKKYETDMME